MMDTVSCEDGENWIRFLQHMKVAISLNLKCITFVSNKQGGILLSIQKVFDDVYYLYPLRKNFANSISNKEQKEELILKSIHMPQRTLPFKRH